MDFVGYRTPQKINFARFRTQKFGTFTHWIGILFCGVLSENTNYQDTYNKMDTTCFKVSSVVLYMFMYVLWLFGAETLPPELYRAS